MIKEIRLTCDSYLPGFADCCCLHYHDTDPITKKQTETFAYRIPPERLYEAIAAGGIKEKERQ